VKDLEAQLQEQEQDANIAITRWQDACSTSDERCTELEKELELMTAKRQTLSESVGIEENDDEYILEKGPASEEKDSSTDDKIDSLESELKSEIVPNTVHPEVSTPEESEDLLARSRQMEDELRQAKESLARSETIVHQLEGKFPCR
jgi:hypothetical protein